MKKEEHFSTFWKKMADSKKVMFLKSPILNIVLWKINGLVLGLVELIDAKGIDVAQPMFAWTSPTLTQK